MNRITTKPTKVTVKKTGTKFSDIQQRNKEMKALRASNLTLEQIGERYGVTKARVLQIVGKKTSHKRHVTANNIRQLVSSFFAENGVYPSLSFIADMADVSKSYVRMLVGELNEQGVIDLKAAHGRIYIKGVKPPEDLPEDVRRKALEQIENQKKEWLKR